MTNRRLALLGALAALALSWSTARAVTDTQDGQSTRGVQQARLGGGLLRADSSMKAFTMSSTGGLSTYDEAPDREAYHVWQNIISADSSAGPDSSALIDVHAYRHLKLLVKIWPINHQAANYVNNLRIAVQVRTHINNLADSLSTFAEYPFAVGAAGMGAAAVASGDTLTVGHISTGSATLQWSGEFVVNIAGNRSAPASGVAATAFSYPSGIALPLDSIFGRDFWAPYVSVRIRITNTNGWKWGGNIHLIGTAL